MVGKCAERNAAHIAGGAEPKQSQHIIALDGNIEGNAPLRAFFCEIAKLGVVLNDKRLVPKLRKAHFLPTGKRMLLRYHKT
jgi:hypothetical protein